MPVDDADRRVEAPDPVPAAAAEHGIRYGEPAGRTVLLATVLGSGMAFVDASIVNVALPAIGRDFDADLSALQWTVNGYGLTLAALVLLGGSLGDLFGRRRVFVIGVVWFAAASLLCGLAPSVETLIAARVLQGVGGALLTPGSLAILQATFVPEDRGRAIGAWSGLGGIAGAVGPFLGGGILTVGSWRWAFLINLPLAVVVLWAARRIPETRGADTSQRLDVTGAVLTVLSLGGITFALTAWPDAGGGSAQVLGGLAVGTVAGAAFVLVERRVPHPMIPLRIFSSRMFSVVNLVTLVVYAAISGAFFLIVLQLQIVGGYGALAAGSALVPMTVILTLLSARAGAIGARTGPRLPLTVGPAIAAAAVVWLAGVDGDVSYLRDVLPPAILFGIGLTIVVAPLTTAVLAAVDDEHTGVASGVNNAVARAGGLLAVAAIPLLVGLDGDAYADPDLLSPAYRSGMLLCAGLLVAGTVLSATLLPKRTAPTP